jgi:hypothetical protein
MSNHVPKQPPDWVLRYITAQLVVVPELGLVTNRTSSTPLGSKHLSGHILVGIGGYRIKRSHIIWWIVTGSWPDQQLDHEDRIKTNDCFDNLRLATGSMNSRNREDFLQRKLPTNVYKDSSGFIVKCCIKGKPTYLKHFPTSQLESALHLNKVAEEVLTTESTPTKELILERSRINGVT